MKIEEINNQELIGLNVTKQVQGILPTTPNEEKRDTISISEEGKQLNEKSRLLKTAAHELQEIPDVRFEKIERAVSRIAENFYERPEIQQKIAENMLHETKELHIAETEQGKSVTFATKVETIRHKIASGFYNNPEVVQKVAEKLLQDIEQVSR